MHFGVLGPVAAWTSAGDPVAIPGIKVRALLADLLLHEGRPVTADRLIDDIWGDRPPGNPSGTLSAKVSQLRRALDGAEVGARELVVSPPPGYRLVLGADSVDARRFLARTAAAADSADLLERRRLLGEALDLWRGPAFADFTDESFTRQAIGRLDEQRLVAYEDLMTTRLQLGEQRGLLGELQELVAQHPLRERLRATQMRALYASGRQGEALASFDHLRRLLADDLGLDPSAELVALQRGILNQDPSLALPEAVSQSTSGPAAADSRPGSGPRTNLPADLSTLFGRDDSITQLRELVMRERLVTLTGPGGVGKTRLALAAARAVIDQFPDGVLLVELASIDRAAGADEAAALQDALLLALDTSDAAAEDAATGLDLVTSVIGHRRMLLLLDNCEHLVESVAALSEALLRAAPGLSILATSQEPLAVAGETVWAVPPLEVPTKDAATAALNTFSAVQLFLARARSAQRDFALDEDTAGPVATLCRRLDGIPLALELAATRVRTLGVHDLVARLDDRFRLLATGNRGAPPRQQTLLAMIDWSWDLLSVPEQKVLRRLAVQPDGCTAEAAAAVCADRDDDHLGEDGRVRPDEVVDLLIRLVDRSLVAVVPGRQSRYRLLESVASYCLARLQDAGEVDHLRRRHRDYYLALAEEASGRLYGSDQQIWLERLDAEIVNHRAALDATVAEGDESAARRLVISLAWYWFLRGRLAEAGRAFVAVAACRDADPRRASPLGSGLAEGQQRPEEHDLEAAAYVWSTAFDVLRGLTVERGPQPDALVRASERIGDPLLRGRSQWFLAYATVDTGDVAFCERLLGLAEESFRATDDHQWGAAAVLVTRAKVAHIRGDTAELERAAERSQHLFEESGDRWGRLQAIEWLGGLAEMTGEMERAAELQREGLPLAVELGLWQEAAGRIAWLGWIAMQQGEYERAQEFCARALRLATDHGSHSGQVFASMGLAFAARRNGQATLAEQHLKMIIDSTPMPGPGEEPPPYLPIVITELGYVRELQGDLRASLGLHRQGITLTRDLDSPRDRAYALEGLSGVAALAGQAQLAAELLGAAAATREFAGLPLSAAESWDVDRITVAVLVALDDQEFAESFRSGGCLSTAQALDRAASLRRD